MIKAVIFDLDGVIVSTDNLHYLAWKKLADREGIYFDTEINNRLRGISRAASLEIILERAEKTYTAEQKTEMMAYKNDLYVQSLAALTRADILDGADELVATLRARGVKTAIASASKNARYILKQIGMDEAFDEIVDGNAVSKSKPDPEVFLTAAARLGVEPKYCAVVEDAYAGIQAAKAGGMYAIAVGDASTSPLADAVADHRKEISDIIRRA